LRCAAPTAGRALWVGLLYDQTSLDAAKELVTTWTAEERQTLRDEVPKTALATPFRNHNVLDIAKDVVDLAREGLKRRAMAGNGSPDESAYLGPLEETVALGRTPAENLLGQYGTRWGRSVEPLFEEHIY
jgi:glutamate--cysteine ligase